MMGIIYKRGIDVEGSCQSTLADFLMTMDFFPSLQLKSLFFHPELEKQHKIFLHQGGLLRAVNKEGYYPVSEGKQLNDRDGNFSIFYAGGLEYQFLRELHHVEMSKNREKSKSIPQVFRYWVQEREISESIMTHPSLETLEKNIESLTGLGIVKKDETGNISNQQQQHSSLGDLFVKYRLQDIGSFWVRYVPEFLE